ncbi:MAG: sulfur carrier protein ThiS [Spirochaetaceae bacterium]
MIIVNGQSMEWEEGLTFQGLFKRLGYTIQNPPVLLRVNGTVIKKSEREEYLIPDGASIEIKNLLRGG